MGGKIGLSGIIKIAHVFFDGSLVATDLTAEGGFALLFDDGGDEMLEPVGWLDDDVLTDENDDVLGGILDGGFTSETVRKLFGGNDVESAVFQSTDFLDGGVGALGDNVVNVGF